MFRIYMLTAWRNLVKHKFFAFIHVFGLALGICACIVIYTVTSYDLSFDAFHEDKNMIYRVGGKVQENNGTDFYTSDVPPPAPNGFRDEIPGLKLVAQYYLYSSKITVPGVGTIDRQLRGSIDGGISTGVIITDSNYFAIFKREWLVGDPFYSMQEPFTVVLTENRARKYFGSIPLNDIIGKTLIYNDSLRLHVSGIVKDWDKNTDFPFTDFISYSTIKRTFLRYQFRTDDWQPSRDNQWINCFVKLSDNASPTQIRFNLAAFTKKHIKKDPLNVFSFQLQPLSDIHFNSRYDHDDIRKASLPALYALIAIALFILAIAIINYINIATALSTQRGREIGVRKVLGGSKSSLRLQFIIETFILVCFAVGVAIVMTRPVLFVFRNFIPEGVEFHLFKLQTFTLIVLLTAITTFLASFYPANVLSSYLPVTLFNRGETHKGRQKWILRRGLIIFQFTISLFFVIATIIGGNQIKYMLNASYGFRTDAIMTIDNWNDQNGRLKIFGGEISKIPGVDQVIFQTNSPLNPHIEVPITYKGKAEMEMLVSEVSGDENYLPFYNIKLIAGKNLSQSDSLSEYLINETYSRALGFKNPQDAIGRFLYYEGKPHPVIGVTADFHQGSFRETIRPAVIGHIPGIEKSIAIKLSMKDQKGFDFSALRSRIEQKWKQIYPESPFAYSFLDESIDSFYRKEQQTIWLMNISMAITIFISCMGLFGLALFSTTQKAKEISVRKILGANFITIVVMLCRNFLTLTMISFLLASPIAWYVMKNWLQNFPYRIDISWWIFVLACGIAVVITLATVGFQAVRAAIANPTKFLRSEG